VPQRSRERSTTLQKTDWLQFDFVAARGRRGPPWLAGARSKIPRARIDADFERRNISRKRGRLGPVQEIGARGFQRVQDKIRVTAIDVGRIGDAEVFA